MNKNHQKFLVIGASGLIGQALIRALDKKYPWEGTTYQTSMGNCSQLDVTSRDDTASKIEKISPSCVVLCSNLSGGVQFCENNPAVTRKWHYEATVNVAEVCHRIGAKLIYISSECVFDGKKEVYRENDVVCPVNIYGLCKVQSEEWIKKNLSQYVIVRTMSVFGWQPETKAPNALMKIYFDMIRKKKNYASTYRWGTPTYVHDLANALIELGVSEKSGLYHVAGPTYINRYDWMLKICQALGWDSSFIIAQNKEEGEPVRYPHKVKLDSSKFSSEFKTNIHNLDESLQLLKKEIPKEVLNFKI